jgi:hypothetical protein
MFTSLMQIQQQNQLFAWYHRGKGLDIKDTRLTKSEAILIGYVRVMLKCMYNVHRRQSGRGMACVQAYNYLLHMDKIVSFVMFHCSGLLGGGHGVAAPAIFARGYISRLLCRSKSNPHIG